MFLDVNEYGLEQCVQEPTRLSDILDLVHASQLSVIKNITTTTGMSDHEVVIFSINTCSVVLNEKNHETFAYYNRILKND